MADIFGVLELPIPVPQGDSANPDESPGDPLLDVSLDYFATLLNTYGGSAWSKIAPNTKPVKTTKANDPDADLDTKDLPTLYLWRSGGDKSDWHAEDILLQRDNLTLYWLLPISRKEFRNFRSNMMPALEKILAQGVHRNRDPAWVWPGDTDPTAATQGSVFSKTAGWFEMHLGKWTQVAFSPTDMPEKASYLALQMQITVAEEYEQDTTIRTDPLTRGNATVETVDHGFSVTRQLT